MIIALEKLALFAFFVLVSVGKNAKCANERWQKRLGKKRINFCVGFSAVVWQGIAYNGLSIAEVADY